MFCLKLVIRNQNGPSDLPVQQTGALKPPREKRAGISPNFLNVSFELTMPFVTVLKAIFARVLFAIHVFISVWRLVELKGGNPYYWYFCAGLLLQAFEAIVSICARNGEEMKWFCPSVFLYLVSVVPPIWLMELELNALRTTQQQKLKQHDHFLNLAGMKINMELKLEEWVRILEQTLMVIVLAGRWLLPKGQMTREQLSQLLLAYMAMGADIIELFECFKEDTVTENVELIYATLAIWSWSLLQFSLVLSATHAPKPRPGMTQSVEMASGENSCSPAFFKLLDMNIIAIVTTVVMQDGPFFLLRMTLIFGYRVVSYMNVFFTCKNTLVVSLQLYRLAVLLLQRSEARKRLALKSKNKDSDRYKTIIEEASQKSESVTRSKEDILKMLYALQQKKGNSKFNSNRYSFSSNQEYSQMEENMEHLSTASDSTPVNNPSLTLQNFLATLPVKEGRFQKKKKKIFMQSSSSTEEEEGDGEEVTYATVPSKEKLLESSLNLLEECQTEVAPEMGHKISFPESLNKYPELCKIYCEKYSNSRHCQPIPPPKSFNRPLPFIPPQVIEENSMRPDYESLV